MPKYIEAQRNARGFRQRLIDVRPKRNRFLIVCEGGKTEPLYFNSFKVPRQVVEIDVRGIGRNTVSLVEEALRLRKTEGFTRRGDQVWCVFDKDDITKAQFNSAIQQAKDNGLRVAYSNEAFELWYVLHFSYMNTGITREQYIEKLHGLLGFTYAKNNPDMFDKLLTKMPEAIKHAKKLRKAAEHVPPADANPSTTVHLLVEALRKHEIV
ncbi:MAG: RloB family protein [Armatimonadota bacterium]